ncbi:hypothetical protein VNO80_24557 [Phaseolus coccineus]|uniref:Tetratricopeptide repeat protein n=1 Tax=Phaseolus coccineus TaxID=3886 RepID=A0AAN9LSN0_PHACN
MLQLKTIQPVLQMDRDNKSAYKYLGLTLASTCEYKKAEEAFLKSLQIDRNYLEAWAHDSEHHLSPEDKEYMTIENQNSNAVYLSHFLSREAQE